MERARIYIYFNTTYEEILVGIVCADLHVRMWSSWAMPSILTACILLPRHALVLCLSLIAMWNSSTTPLIATSCLIPYSGTNIPAQNEPAMPDTALMYTTSVLSKLQESITESGYHISLLARYQHQRNITCNLVITTHSLA
jgi:hypothetical protein